MTEIVRGDICAYYGDTKPINGLEGGHGCKSARMSADGSKDLSPHLIETARALRHFVRGKPQGVRDAVHNIISGFRTVIAGRAEPHTYRMLGEHVERLGGGR